MRLKVIKLTTVMSLALAFALTALVAAQQGAKPGQQKPGGQMTTMDEMMKECRKHCQETAKSIDQTTKTLEEANQSNDPAMMRAANDQARKALAEMENRMSRCMNMMDMTKKMGGTGQKEKMQGDRPERD